MQILIWASLIWTLLGALCLIAMLLKDWKDQSIW